MDTPETNSKTALWIGRILSILVVLFLLMDIFMKIFMTSVSIKSSVQLGWPGDSVKGLGILLLALTILFIIPRTTFYGAILLTGYLGGAVAIMFRADLPGHPYIFPFVFGILMWVGLGLRNAPLRKFLCGDPGKPAVE
ncbi:MAG TPA: DoxX family protein [Chitinophagaceae bacterium]|nr:DoxX family protein [Chitinophagaceae bacterium]